MKLSINETKIKSTIGFALAFVVAYGPELVTWIGGLETSPKWLRDIAKGLGVFIGVLTSKNGVAVLNWFTKAPDVIPLLDGSAVVQVRPPTVPGGQSLSHVAVDPTPFATNTAAVVPLASMQTGDVPGKVLPMVADDAPTGNIRPRDKGAISGWLLAVLAGIGLGLCVMFAWTSTAHAAEPATRTFGGCIIWQDDAHTICKLEAGPTVAVTIGRYQDGKFSAGLLPGIGYGVVLAPAEWYAVGLAAYGQLLVGNGQNQAALSGLFSFANYVRFGIGQTWAEQPTGPALRSTAYLFGLGADFGGNPSYVAKQAKMRATAEKSEQP
jgi:hypothetical protein